MSRADVGYFLEEPRSQTGDTNPGDISFFCVLGLMAFQLLRPDVQAPWKSSEMGQDDLQAHRPSSATH